MSDLRSQPERPQAENLPSVGEVQEDLQAMRSVTLEDQPNLDMFLREARRRRAGETGEGFSMALNLMKRRPALAVALGVVMVAVALLVIPISYERTVGYDVALTLDGANVTQDQAKEIARSFKESVGTPGTMLEASMNDGRQSYVLRAAVTPDARASGEAFAKQLKALGYGVSIESTPRRETVSTNLYAYAMSQVIEVNLDGKSAAQLESEIRDRLAAAGVTNAQVSVTDVGENGRKIKINVDHESHDGTAPEALPELKLTKNGAPLDGGLSVRMMKKRQQGGATTLVVTVTEGAKSVDIEIPNAESTSDAAVSAAIESKLAAAGINAIVKVTGDDISVEKRAP